MTRLVNIKNNKQKLDMNIKVSRAKSRSQINDERQKMVVYLTNISQGVGKTDLEENYPELKNIKQLKVCLILKYD